MRQRYKLRQKKNSSKRWRVLHEALESRQLLSVTPGMMTLDGTTMTAGETLTWNAGIALHLRAVNGVDGSSNPTGPTTFTGNSNPNNTQLVWNFGDTAATTDADYTSGVRYAHNVLTGFNVAHVYDTAGIYTATLATTDETGTRNTFSINVDITSGAIGSSHSDVETNTGNILYVDSVSGNDSYSGVAPSFTSGTTGPLASFHAAIGLLLNNPSWQTNVQIRFKRGETFNVFQSDFGSLKLKGTNVILGAYGATTLARPILNGDDTTLGAIITPYGSADDMNSWTIQDINFNESVADTSNFIAYGDAVDLSGNDITVRDCVFGHFHNDLDGVGTVHGILAEDNSDQGNWVNFFGFDIVTSVTANETDVVALSNSFTGASIDPGNFGDGQDDQAYEIGAPSPFGSSNYGTSVASYVIQGAGAGIGGTSDQFHYQDQGYSGNGSITAEVTSQSSTHSGAQAGVMIRTSTSATTAYAEVGLTPSSGVIFSYRASAGAAASQTTVSGITAPTYLKLTNSGSSYSAYYSSNGASWTQIGTTQTLAIATGATAGLAVTSGANGILSTADFSHAGVTPSTFPVTGRQPFWRFEPSDGTGFNGRFLFEGNAIEPTKANFDALTFRQGNNSGVLVVVSYVYVTDNTIGNYDANFGSKTGAFTESNYVDNYFVVDSNTFLNSNIELNDMGDHITIRDNLVENNGGPDILSYAIQETSPQVVHIGANSFGETNVQILNNTNYNTYTEDGGRLVHMNSNWQSVTIANNLEIAPNANNFSYGLEIPTGMSLSQFVEISDNIYPTATSIEFGTSIITTAVWNTSYRRGINSGTYSSSTYDDVSANITFNSTTIAPTTTAANIGQPVTGIWTDKNGVPRTVTPWTDGAIDTVSPNAPQSVSATGGANQVSLSWTLFSGAGNYNIYRATSTGAETLVAAGITSTSYTDTSLASGTSYYYQITAVSYYGESGKSSEASATTNSGTGVPSAPTGVAATGGNGQIALSWFSSTGATSYSIYRGASTGGETLIKTGVTTTSYTDTTTAAGTTYFYEVTAVNISGESTKSSEVSALTIPAAPTGLTATGGAPQISLSWTASTSATSYDIYRSTVTGGETLATTGVTATSYTDSTTASSTTYYYKVAAVDSSGTGTQSSEVSATTSAPTGDTFINVSETSPATAASVQANLQSGSVIYVDRTYTYTTLTTSGGAYNFAGYDYLETANNDKTESTYALTYTLANGSYVYLTMDPRNITTPGLPSGTSAFSDTGQTIPMNGLGFEVYRAWEPAGTYTLGSQVSGNDFYTLITARNNVSIPTGLIATGGAGQVSLSWSSATNASTYNIYRGASTGAETLYATGVATTSYTDTGVSGGTTYYYKISGVNSASESPLSFEVSALTIPSVPAGLSATGGTAQVSLSWTASTGANTYNIYRGASTGGETLYLTGVATNAYTDTGLSTGTTYYYNVTAVDTTGESAKSTEASGLTIPAAPTGLTATGGTNQVLLSWTASTGASTYNVYRGASTGGETLLTTGVATAAYTDTAVTGGTTYYYKVAAVDTSGTSALSTEASATPTSGVPTAPSNLTATTAASYQINLTWQDNSSNETGFTVQRASDTAFTQLVMNFTVGANVTSYSDSAVAASTIYYYRVEANGSAGNSTWSSSANATTSAASGDTFTSVSETSPSAAVSVQQNLQSGSVIYVDRTYPYTNLTSSGGTYDFTGYDYLQTANTDKTESTYALTYTLANGSYVYLTMDLRNLTAPGLPSGTSAFSDTGETILMNGLGFEIYRAWEPAGTYTLGSQVSGNDFYTILTARDDVSTPTGLAATGGTGQVSLSWTSATNATTYNIYRGASTGGETLYATGVATNSYTDTSVSNGTNYFYKVSGVDSTSESLLSSEASALTIPGAPTGLSATGGTTQVTLNWSATTGAATYNIYRSTTAGGETLVTTGIATTTYTDTGLTAATTYYYKITAVDSSGESAKSSEASATTNSSAPAAPTSLGITDISTTQINLTWVDNSSNETGFTIQRATNTTFTSNLTSFTVGSNVISYSDTSAAYNTTYSYRVEATNAGGNSTWSNTATAATPNLQYGLFGTDVNIGTPSPTGTTTYVASTGTYTVTGGGADIWSTADQFNFVESSFTGDGYIQAKVTSQTNTNATALAGVMIRNDTTAGAAFADASVTAGSGVVFRYRATAGGTVAQTYGPAISAPAWLKLTRAAGSFSAYYSTDGNTWTQIGSTQSLTLSSGATAGLAVCSHANGTASTAVFTNVNTGLGLFSSDLNIGNATPTGAAAYTASSQTYTLSSSGLDVWNTQDQFNFLSEGFSGNGTIIAKVSAQQNTEAYAKAGVIFANSNVANDLFADVVVTPTNGIQMDYRTTAGASATYNGTSVTGVSAPIWLEMTRSGNSFSAYYSTNGATWTQVGATQVVAMSTSATIGLLDTSGLVGTLNTSTFTNVAITSGGFTSDLDIGAASPFGYANFNSSNSVYSLASSGSDIWGTSDQFNFLSQTVSGNSTVIAEVNFQGDSGAYAKSGIMYRNTTAAGDLFADVVVTPTNGIQMDYRTTSGASAVQSGTITTGVSAPVWLKLTRSGNSFTAYYSTNGSSYTQVGSMEVVAMGTNAAAGLAMTSFTSGTLNTSTFTNVST